MLRPGSNDGQHEAVISHLGDLNRSANASIRGYLTQITYSAVEWLDLNEQEVLVVEGREDLDHFILDKNGQVLAVREEQLKDLTDAVNFRSEPVRESIFNFLLAYHRHQKAGRDCQLLFATTADKKAQRTASSTKVRQTPDTTRLDLDIDGLTTWMSLEKLTDDKREYAVDSLANAVLALFKKHLSGYMPPANAGESKLSAIQQKAQSVQKAIEWLKTSSSWNSFFTSVRWITNLPSAEEQRSLLEKRISEHPKFTQLPPQELSWILIYHVLSAASQDNVAERILTVNILHNIASQNAESLRQWAKVSDLYIFISGNSILRKLYLFTNTVSMASKNRFQVHLRTLNNFVHSLGLAWDAFGTKSLGST